MPKRPPLIVHRLPKAPKMMGRSDLLVQVREFLGHGTGVASLVGIGGAGKTTVIRQILDEILEQNPYDGILVWSFYDDPDTNAFLQTAVSYFAAEQQATSQGAGWFHALRQALDSGERFLLVLDGLERVQRPITDAQGVYGELEDPLLRGILVRLASHAGPSKALITSRFTIANLEKWTGSGFLSLPVDQLEPDAAHELLRAHGARGTDAEICAVCQFCGGHALTIDLLGAAIARFFDGNVARALTQLGIAKDDNEVQSNRLQEVLKIYEEHLSPIELDLLSRLCVFRFGIRLDALETVFLDGDSAVAGELTGISPQELARHVDELVSLHLVHLDGPDQYSVHPAVRDHFYARFRDVAKIHGAISEHFTTLVQRPGVGLPTDKAALDLLEELVHHALRAGAEDQALEIFLYRMGGGDHLNVTLGEYVRTHRILSAFPSVPEAGSMYRCMRAFGRFDDALKWRPQNRYIKVLTGHLKELREDTNPVTNRIARLLRGESNLVPPRAPDHPLPPAILHLLIDQVDDALATARSEMTNSLHRDDIIRNRLALMEAYRRKRQPDAAAKELANAADWVMQSGSVEHLALMFLFRGRLEADQGKFDSARLSLEEALQLAIDSGFLLVEVEARTDMARLLKDVSPESALLEARRAIELASHDEVGYFAGEQRARIEAHACLVALGRDADAAIMKESLAARAAKTTRLSEVFRHSS